MDFNPDHEKWQFCCCNISVGIKILSFVEVVISLVCALFLVPHCYQNAQSSTNSLDWFDVGLLVFCFLMFVGSLLLLIGMITYHAKLMYMTLFVRALLVIFLAAFGVNRFVIHSSNNKVRKSSATVSKLRKSGSAHHNEQEEGSTALRLIMLIIFMTLMNVIVFYSIFLVVRAIRFVKAFSRLQNRRQSLILASQIDLKP